MFKHAIYRWSLIIILIGDVTIRTSSQAKGTNSTSFLTHARNEVELVPLACEDAIRMETLIFIIKAIFAILIAIKSVFEIPLLA